MEELRDRLAAGLRVGGGTGGDVLGGSEVGDALGRVVDEIGDSHDVVRIRYRWYIMASRVYIQGWDS